METTKLLGDLLYVRKKIFTEGSTESDKIKAHAVLSKIIDYFRWCEQEELKQKEGNK